MPQVPVVNATPAGIGGGAPVNQGLMAPRTAGLEWEGVTALGEAGSKAAAAMQHVEAMQRKAAGDLEAADALQKLKIGYAEDAAQVMADGTPGEVFAQTTLRRFDARAQALSQSLRYPEARQRFAAHTSGLRGTLGVDAVQQGVKLKHGQILMQNAEMNAEDINTVVFGYSHEDSADAMTRLLTRNRDMVSTGVMSGKEGEADKKATLHVIEKAGAERDAMDPTRLPDVVGRLLSDVKGYSYIHLKPDERLTLARQFMTQADTAQKKRDDELAKAEAKAKTEGYARLTDAVLGDQAGTPRPTEQQVRADPVWFALDAGQREHVIKMIREPAVGPSDTPTRARVWNAVFRDTPIMAEAEVLRLNSTKGANGLPLLNDADTAAANLQIRARKDRAVDIARAERHRAEDKAQSDTERRHGEAMTLGVSALLITGLSEKLDPKQTTLQAELRDAMYRGSQGAGQPTRGFPRNQEPEKVLYGVLPDLIVKAQQDQAGEIEAIRRGNTIAGFRTPADLFRKYPGDPATHAANAEYTQALKRFQALDAAVANQVRLEEERKKAAEQKKRWWNQ